MEIIDMRKEKLRTDLFAVLRQKEFTLGEIESAIFDYHNDISDVLPAETVVAKAARSCGIDPWESKKRSRKREYVVMRWLVWMYFDQKTKTTLASKGRIFGKDHATVLNGLRALKLDLKNREPFATECYNKFNKEVKLS